MIFIEKSKQTTTDRDRQDLHKKYMLSYRKANLKDFL